MKHSDDVRIVSGDVQAKLKTDCLHSDYAWRGWKIWKAHNVSNHKLNGKKGYYAEHEDRGLWFACERISYARMVLPDYEALSSDGEAVPKGCHKTPERKRAEYAARPYEEKLAAANERVIQLLKGKVKEAEKHKRKFLKEAKADLLHAIQWGHSTVLMEYLGRNCKDVLLAPAERLPMMVAGRRKSYAKAMIENHFQSGSSGSMYRAVENIRLDAVKHFIEILDNCISIYESQGVELKNYRA